MLVKADTPVPSFEKAVRGVMDAPDGVSFNFAASFEEGAVVYMVDDVIADAELTECYVLYSVRAALTGSKINGFNNFATPCIGKKRAMKAILGSTDDRGEDGEEEEEEEEEGGDGSTRKTAPKVRRGHKQGEESKLGKNDGNLLTNEQHKIKEAMVRATGKKNGALSCFAWSCFVVRRTGMLTRILCSIRGPPLGSAAAGRASGGGHQRMYRQGPRHQLFR
jgi:hypothetical protein